MTSFVFQLFRPYGVSGLLDTQRVNEIAIESQDVGICDQIHLRGFADITTNELKAYCYVQYVKSHPDQDVCSRINNDFACVKARAIALNNSEVCLGLAESREIALCFAYVAGHRRDSTICELLPNLQSQQQCQQYFQSLY